VAIARRGEQSVQGVCRRDRGALGVAGRTDSTALAREGDEEILRAGRAAEPNDAEARDAALQEGAKRLLRDRRMDSGVAVAPSEIFLEVVLEKAIERVGLSVSGTISVDGLDVARRACGHGSAHKYD
jgi:hypothetical protein